MFHKCSDKCLCASSQPGGKETVLYCFGEVVLKKDSLRGEEASQKSQGHQTLDEYHLQLTQLVLIFILFMFV